MSAAQGGKSPQEAGARALAAAIAVQKLPAFGASLNAIKQLTGSPLASGQDLADAILRDPALTSSVLRAANLAIGLSAYREDRVRTVSRAVVVLGMNALETLCATSLAVEHMHQDISHVERMREAVGRAIHAATQARNLAQRRGVSREDSEKLFVEAVLSNLGEVAFWCFGEAAATNMDALLSAGVPRQQAEKQVLGMSFEGFSEEILKHWSLDNLLLQSPPVSLANAFCLAAVKGLASDECKDSAHKIAIYLSVRTAEASKVLAKNAADAVVIARALGLRESLKYIPPQDHAEDAPPDSAEFGVQDPALQLKTLFEMVSLARDGGTMSELFEACVAGLHSAVGLDRVVLVLFDAGRTEMLARIARGVPAGYREAFRVPACADLTATLLPGAVLECGVGRRRPAWLPHAHTSSSCILATVSVGRNVLGAIYADRAPSRRDLDEQTVQGFRAFAGQLDLACLALSRARG
jgi:HD-like signal output (HDOD) protein